MLNKLSFLHSSFSKLNDNWQIFFEKYCYNDIISIDAKLSSLADSIIIYPHKDLIFSAFSDIAFEKINVVILGQNPYHNENQANGLSFAVNSDVKKPPSLKNIYKELQLEYPNLHVDLNGDYLNTWVKQGVMLLNSSLTVEKSNPNSMLNIGWERVTDSVIKYINDNNQNCVFMMWGNFAKQKIGLIDSNKHLILVASHPSPFSFKRNKDAFYGCNHFLLANQYLTCNGKEAINWLY